MIIEGYGIRLIRLQAQHLELLRQQRNSAFVRSFMEYREYISPAMQREWFAQTDNQNNNYYLIEHDGKFIGLINAAGVDWEKKETRSGGIFIWQKDLLQTPVPLRASFLLTDISFLYGLERSYIKVLRNNAKAIAYNRALGYELLPGQENLLNQEYLLTQDAYETKTGKLREILRRQFPYPFLLTWDDPENDSTRFAMNRYASLPEAAQEKMKIITP